MKKLLIFTGIVIFLLAGQGEANSDPALIWLLMDQLSLEELITAKTPHLDYLQQRGAFALLNVRTAGHLKAESTYLSAGSGNRCQGSKISHLGINVGKGVFNPQVEKLIAINQASDYGAEIALLGETAKKQGIVIGVIGNADTGQEERRTIVALTMDQEGRVPLGDVSKALLSNTSQAWGYQSDWLKIQERFQEYRKIADAIFIETGDLSRIEAYRGELDSLELQEAKLTALERIDKFLGFLLQEIDLNKTQVGIIVPTPPPAEIEAGRSLSFILLAGPGIQPGWLYTSRTRRPGILTISDILPLFLQVYQLKLQDQPQLSSRQEELSWQNLYKLNTRISQINNWRPFFIKVFIILQLIIIVLAILKYFYSPDIINYLLEYLLIALFLIPCNYLLISRFSSPLVLGLALLLLSTVEVIILLRFFQDRLLRILLITASLDLILILDLFTGYRLMADSLLGYSSIIGARFYGMGNEYMGLFIGSLLFSLLGFRAFFKAVDRIIFPFLLFIVYLLGSASLGANFGGTITAIFAGGFSYLYLRKNSSWLKPFLLSSLIFGVLIYLDYRGITGPPSHIGQALAKLLEGDFNYLSKIIQRKVAMNLKLLRWTIWTRVLLAFMVYLVFLFRRPVPVLKRVFNRYPELAAAFYGSLVGGFITILVNDSGVVAAATLLFYPLLSILYLIDE